MDEYSEKNRIILFTFVVLGSIVSAEAACDLNALNQCTALFTSIATGTTNLTDQALTQACATVNNLSACMGQQGCSDKDVQMTAVWLGLRDGFTYLCGEARQVVLSNPPCIRMNVTQQHLHACDVAYMKVDKSKKETVCPGSQNMLICSRNQLVGCPVDVTKVYITYLQKTLVPIISPFNCTLDVNATKISGAPCGAPSWTMLGLALLASAVLLLKGA